jgi:hypothetical protein
VPGDAEPGGGAASGVGLAYAGEGLAGVALGAGSAAGPEQARDASETHTE